VKPEVRILDGIQVQVFDLTHEPVQIADRQWSRHTPRSPQDQRGVCLHQWEAKVGTEARFRLQWGEPEALARRALKVPAHISVGVTERGNVPIVSIAHPLDRYVFHGDAANAHFLGFEVMGLFPFLEEQRTAKHTLVTPQLQAAVTVGLQVAAQLLEEWTKSQGPWELVTHRQGCNSKGDHLQCCGESVVQMAMRSQDLYIPNPDEVLSKVVAEPWPPAWRAHLTTSQIPCTPVSTLLFEDRAQEALHNLGLDLS
jgi:hypothetical protein